MLSSVEFIALFMGIGILFVEWKIALAYYLLVIGLIIDQYTWVLIPNTNVYDIYAVALFVFILAFVLRLTTQEK